ncbi:MAG: Smr/MutS family protein [Desulfobacteraceae bacterium]|jgi:DNA-nicking Smr family endonuclease
MKKKKDLFNPAFENLDVKLKRSQKRSEQAIRDEPIDAEDVPKEKDYFLEAMSDVTPLPADKKRGVWGQGTNIRPSHPAPDADKEAMAHLQGLVRASIEMDITFSDEYIEGSIKGFSRKLMKQLKGGEFPVQDYTDLHGLTKQEAKTAVRDFLHRSYGNGLRCVLIVHGRGLNSPDSFPVLKEGLPVWLGRGSIRKIVLAFATARPYDGGTGAIYVLLRKR